MWPMTALIAERAVLPLVGTDQRTCFSFLGGWSVEPGLSAIKIEAGLSLLSYADRHRDNCLPTIPHYDNCARKDQDK